MTIYKTSQLSPDTTGPKGNMADYQHAARLFVDNDMRLAPKSKFNFHVVFSINSAVINSSFSTIDRNEINMLVKHVDLPQFELSTVTANQYNRKKVIQIKSELKPVTIALHDDNEGVIRRMWESYYGYYYADYNAAKKETNYSRSAMKSSDYIKSGYGLDNKSSIPFFSKITVYQMAKQKWNSFSLINPIISNWKHDQMNYAIGNSLAEHQMTVVYESVAYDTGDIAQDNPSGFGIEHYDTSPSSLTLGVKGSVLWTALNNV